MFPRKIKNRSGSVTVKVFRKESGRYRVIRTFGTSHDPDEIERLWLQAQSFIHADPYQGKLFALESPGDLTVRNLVTTLKNTSVRVIGPELIYGTLFDRLGFNQIPEELFRHIVIARLAYPCSKLKTVEYLYRYQGVDLSVSTVYTFLDRLHNRYKSQVEEISYRHTCAILKTVTVVFYDVTTLYFEAEEEDDLRKIGFSKDGKFQHPQIMLGLLVGEEGYPIGYDLFVGNTYEGHTLLPILKKFEVKYRLPKPVVVADAAMLSKKNLAQLKAENYGYIIGARIKNESQSIQQEILEKSKTLENGAHFVISYPDGRRLIVTYSAKRARKDAKNREKGLARLEKRLKTGKMTKQHLNNRGYNKFLAMEGDLRVRIDERKVEEDKQWDGLKGYISNTDFSPDRIVEGYSNLWKIERAFRISKTDLRIRPIYHYRRRRIEAHLCVAFVAYTICKELERLLKQKNSVISLAKAGMLTHTMYELGYTLPDSQESLSQILAMDEEQKILYDAVHRP